MRFLLLLVSGLWECVSFGAMVLIAFLALIGAMAVSDALQPPNLPRVRAWPAGAHRVQAECLRWVDGEGETRWGQVQKALRILDVICPEVSAWVRDRHDCGHLIFEETEKPYYACWWVVPRVLIINHSALTRSDAEIAGTLAHEFRHSRQPILRVTQAVIAEFAGLDRRHELCEAEAYQFEATVRRAIKGEK